MASGRPTDAVLAERRAIFTDTIRRFDVSDMDDWFLARLEDRWPLVPVPVWRAKFASYAKVNEFLCVTNDMAVGLFYHDRDIVTGEIVVHERFAWSRDAYQVANGDWTMGEKDFHALRAIYRRAFAWRDGMRASRTVVGQCSDLTPSMLKREFDGHYLVVVQ